MLAEEYERLKETYKACLIGGLCFLFGLSVFFGLGIFMLIEQIKAQSYVPTQAVVVDYAVWEDSDGDDSYSYVVEYEFDGETYRKTSDTSVSLKHALNDRGKVITVYVNPDNPKDVVFRNSTHFILITACLGIPLIGYVIIAFVLRKAYRTKKILNEYKV